MNKSIFMRIDQLMKHQKKKIKDLNDYLGLKQSTYDNWKRGKSESYLKHIDEIAEFIGVSPGYLLRGIEDGPEEGTKTAAEDEMLRVFRKLSPKKKECVIQVARTLLLEGLENEK